MTENWHRATILVHSIFIKSFSRAKSVDVDLEV